MGVFITGFNTSLHSQFKCRETTSESWSEKEMEFPYVFVSAVLVCVVSADIPDHGIHWTYSGRFYAFWICMTFFWIRFALPTEKVKVIKLAESERVWCVKRAPQPIRVHVSVGSNKTAKKQEMKCTFPNFFQDYFRQLLLIRRSPVPFGRRVFSVMRDAKYLG